MQAIRRVVVRKSPKTIDVERGSSNRGKNSGTPRRVATVIVATTDVADLLYAARGEPELGHAEVERIARSKKTVPDWDLEQEQEPLNVFGLQVIDFDPSECKIMEKKFGTKKGKCERQSPADPPCRVPEVDVPRLLPAKRLWSVDVEDVRRNLPHFQKRPLCFWDALVIAGFAASWMYFVRMVCSTALMLALITQEYVISELLSETHVLPGAANRTPDLVSGTSQHLCQLPIYLRYHLGTALNNSRFALVPISSRHIYSVLSSCHTCTMIQRSVDKV
jgi:hypothetical protein